MTKENENKICYLDILRVIAMMSVILLHITSKAISFVDEDTISWYIYNFIRCTCKWGVNIFIMISGALFLNNKKNITIKILYGKYIKKIVVVLVVWSFFYAIQPLVKEIIQGSPIIWSERWDSILKNIVLGHFHLWYLYMIIGLYIITPILRQVVTDKEKTTYFLGLAFVFSVILPLIIKIKKLELLANLLNQLHVNTVTGYVFFYVLGYYLNTYDISLLKVRFSKILCLISFFITLIITTYDNGGLFVVDGVFSLGVTMTSLSLFVIFKYGKINNKVIKGFENISKYSLGIYLIHVLFVTDITIKSIEFFKPGIDIVVSFVMVFILSYICIFVIKRIPVIGRKIV